ncbi:GerAB/ArcD/ProY family transporter [Paenibacillus sp. 19GGS1-52]|uniref:YkvI family membrane protein n=1 Tax=Paenibacillus sp. 19GGS1-52 TaxID=2758563 RepID=UPI001EFBBE67|nr:GerAB/ArcD/ProY family transporter [Paenibacillus sp. 19GGS1-52]ULO05680.1 GerAB/ArcD/ProY family transporter [Paenibacillus sp. 19GGS1-52]
MKSHVRTLQIAFTYIGTIVGAGFATGQEILKFFTQYGQWAVLTILLSTILFIWLGTKMMIIARRIEAESYEDFNRHLFGEKVGSSISLFTMVILIGVNSIMLAGAGAIFQEHLGLHYQTGLLLTLLGSYFLLKRGISGILQMNSIVVPLMLTLSLIIIFNTFEIPNAGRFLFLDTDSSIFGAWMSPLLYTAFNLAMAQAVLVPLARHTDKERALVRGGILGGIGIGFMLLAAHFAMSSQMPGILQFEIPMGSIAFRLGTLVQTVYLLLIFLEIFSTFVADIYGVGEQLKQHLRIAPSLITPLLMLICYLLSQFGFSSLLSVFYPIFGALSLIWAVKLLRTPWSSPPHKKQSSSPHGSDGKNISSISPKPVTRFTRK